MPTGDDGGQELSPVDDEVRDFGGNWQKPRIRINGVPLEKQHNKAMAALQARNNPPHLFIYDGKLARVEQHHSKRTGETKVAVSPLTVQSLRYELELSAYFYTYNQEKGTQTPAPPSRTLCENILAEPSYDKYTFPEIVRVVTAPIVTKDGHIIVNPGYDERSGIFYHVTTPLKLPDIKPTPENIDEAKRLIFDHLLVNFPFSSDADKANAVAYLIAPFCREMINGPTPLHLFSAPVQGSGKSLLGGLLTRVFNPLQGFSPVPKDLGAEEELRKVITTKLINRNSHMFFDNMRGKLDSANFATILTTTRWSDRILGQSTEVVLENRAIWGITGNNLTLGDDMIRRTVEIRLDPQCENPEERKNFRHPNIQGWAQKFRGELIGAILTLIGNWLAKGKPEPVDAPMIGSFEHWRHVVGGILESAGIAGFLQNRKVTAERVDASRSLWVGFFEMWYEKYGSTSMKPSELHEMAKQAGLFEDVLYSKTEKGEITRLGRGLNTYQDRIFGGLRLERIRVKKNSQYRLVSIKGDSLGSSKTDSEKLPPSQNIENSHESVVGVVGGSFIEEVHEGEKGNSDTSRLLHRGILEKTT